MSKRNFLIVDFSAGNIITHHLNYVITYGLFLQDLGYIPKLVLPKYTPIKELRNVNFPIERVLISRFYRLSKRYVLFNSIYQKVLKFMGTIGTEFSLTIDAYRDSRNLNKSLRRLIKIILKEGNCEIIFPTVDLYTLQFIDKLMKFERIYEKIYLRINSIEGLEKEIKGITGLKLLEKLSNIYSDKIVIGCETMKIVRVLENKIKTVARINFVPLPFANRNNKVTKQNIFGFIGGAKRRKGFCEIPNLINKINNVLTSATFLVQQSPFNWEGYTETIIELKRIRNVELLPGVLSNQAFFEAISKCNFIVMPYDQDSYLTGGSSIFYYASDLLIPVITVCGLPFSEEIQMFDCGILFEPGSDFEITDFDILNQEKFHKNLINYNKYRKNLNIDFIKFSDII